MHEVERIEGNGYPIFVGSDAGKAFQQWFEAQPEFSSIYILVDENTHEHCLPVLDQWGIEALKTAEVLEIESGEEHKNIAICHGLWESLHDLGADRHALLINLGGGVIGDLGGFVAATWHRGMRFVQIPTTLLAMVDASVGGKLGVDLHHYKNQIGVFRHPDAVIVDPAYLDTLPEQHLRNGMAEMIKHAVIADAAEWDFWRHSDLPEDLQVDLTSRISQSIALKNKVVLADPEERGLRKILNFGHSLGHAIETWSLGKPGQELLHGESVALGMLCEAWLAHQILGFPQEQLEELTAVVLKNFSLVSWTEQDVEQIVENIRSDKKNKGNTLMAALPPHIGSCEPAVEFTDTQAREALAWCQGLKA